MTDAVALSVIAKLDAKLDQMAKDMTRGFEAIIDRLTDIEERIAGLETRMTAMEARSADTTARLDRIERRLGLVEEPPA